MKSPKFTESELSTAASLLGAASWQSRVEKLGLPQLREKLSVAGKLGGRPRKEEENSQDVAE